MIWREITRMHTLKRWSFEQCHLQDVMTYNDILSLIIKFKLFELIF